MYRRINPILLACLASSQSRLISSSSSSRHLSQDQSAVYSSTFEAPACLQLGSSCDSGTLLGGVKSFERNYPNTVDSCEDTSEAVYQRDEYINSITVRSKDGGVMKAGEKLQVIVNVDTATSVTGRGREDARETLHIYWASQHIGESNACNAI